MASRPRMAGNVKARLSLEPRSYARFKAQLKELERAVRKEIIEEALLAGGKLIYDEANARLGRAGLVLRIVGGRTLRKKIDPKFANVVKSNGKFAAIGPDAKHWYLRFFEFGATPHDIQAKRAGMLRFEGRDGTVFVASARQTGGVKMRPFLRPAVDNRGEDAVKAMGAVLKREIEKAATT